jgi:hypothetical protein
VAVRDMAAGEVVARIPLSLLLNIEHVLVDRRLGPVCRWSLGSRPRHPCSRCPPPPPPDRASLVPHGRCWTRMAGVLAWCTHGWATSTRWQLTWPSNVRCSRARCRGTGGPHSGGWHQRGGGSNREPWLALLPPLTPHTIPLTYTEELLRELQASPLSGLVRRARVSLVETHERLLALPGFSGPRGSGAACRRYSHDEHVRARARKHGIITPFRSNPIYQTVPEKSVRIMRSTGVGATRGDEPDAHRACQRRRRQLALDPLPRAGLLSHVLCVLLACVCKPSVPQCLRTV